MQKLLKRASISQKKIKNKNKNKKNKNRIKRKKYKIVIGSMKKELGEKIYLEHLKIVWK